MNEIKVSYAKPEQTYKEHIERSYIAWKDIIKSTDNLLNRLSKKLQFDKNRFIESSLLTIVLHDFGKNIEQFQSMMCKVRNKEKINFNENYRHELVSVIYIFQYTLALNKEKGYLSRIPLESLAVLSHHKRLNVDMRSFERESNSTPIIYKNLIETATEQAKDIFKREGYNLPDIVIKSNLDPYNFIKTNFFGIKGIFGRLYNKEDPEKTKILYLLLKSILNYSDWHASAGININYSLKINKFELINNIEKRCANENITYSGLRPFQEECAHTFGNIIAIAPTGSGKTEASLLWALNNNNGGKIIYLLPTMVTANSIFKRMKTYFGKENVGLTHSTATYVLDSEEHDVDNIRNVLFDKTFIKPVTVATVDQLLTSRSNTGKWCVKELNILDSVIIIDEIHSYDPYTMGLIVESIKYFSKFGTKFMIMSATLPNHLINLLLNIIPDAHIIKDENLLKSHRSDYVTTEKYIDDLIPDIEKSVNKKNKTLVVVNTIAKCQEIYKRLKHLNPMCYHSKFIIRDRNEKEKYIDDQSLLISTQAVEVSLDIDYDVMFTECAPSDAIVQRSGRVNRRRSKLNSKIVICKPSEKSKRIYSEKILSKSYEEFNKFSGNLTEENLTEIVERTYAGTNIDDDKDYINSISLYKDIQDNLCGIFDNNSTDFSTRKVEYAQDPVIPLCFKDIVLKLKPKERRLYEIKMPWWYIKEHKEELRDIIFCDMNYDSEIGAQYKKKEENKNTYIF